MTKAQAPQFKVSLKSVDDLVPDPGNPRTHSEAQVDQIIDLIRSGGFWEPIKVREGGRIVMGHGRRLAVLKMRKLGLDIHLPPGPPKGAALPPGMVPVLDCSGWTDEQARAFMVADNKVAQNAGWEDTLLRDALAGVGNEVDATLTGFGEKEIDKLLATGETDDLTVFEMPTGMVSDRFWVAVRGPLARQAEALQRLQELMAEMPEVEVTLGTTAVDP